MSYKRIRKIANLSKADLHIHSNFSDGKPTIEEILDYVNHKTSLEVIAITDHDTIEGALLAQKIAKEKKLRFEVVIGEEISTKEGHILGLYLHSAIKPNLSLKDTLVEIHRQKGIAIAAHPFQHTRFKNPNMAIMNGVGLNALISARKSLDALETVNATPTLYDENIRADFVNKTILHRGETGSSDAHIVEAIGQGYTVFEGKTAKDLKRNLRLYQTRAMSRRWTLRALLKYLYFFIPISLRMTFYTLLHGRAKKETSL